MHSSVGTLWLGNLSIMNTHLSCRNQHLFMWLRRASLWVVRAFTLVLAVFSCSMYTSNTLAICRRGDTREHRRPAGKTFMFSCTDTITRAHTDTDSTFTLSSRSRAASAFIFASDSRSFWVSASCASNFLSKEEEVGEACGCISAADFHSCMACEVSDLITHHSPPSEHGLLLHADDQAAEARLCFRIELALQLTQIQVLGAGQRRNIRTLIRETSVPSEVR